MSHMQPHASTAGTKIQNHDQPPIAVAKIDVQPHSTEARKNSVLLSHSDSYQKLMESNALSQTLDLCEVFVIIGAHEEVLSMFPPSLMNLEKALADIDSG